MGSENRNPTHSTFSPMPAAPPAAAPTPEIRSECEGSLTAFRQGDHTKALELIGEPLAKHGDSAFVHRVHGAVHAKLVSSNDDPTLKQIHVKAAIESAKRATELAPNWIDSAHFYGSLLFDYTGESELAMAECERALRVDDPLDPAEESLHVSEETDSVASTPETRIREVKEELKSLIQKCNLASITAWMKSLHEGRYGLTPAHGSFNEQVAYGVPTGPSTAGPHLADN